LKLDRKKNRIREQTAAPTHQTTLATMVLRPVAKMLREIARIPPPLLRGMHKPRRRRSITCDSFTRADTTVDPSRTGRGNVRNPPELPRLPLSGPLLAPRPFRTPPNVDPVAHAIVTSDALSSSASSCHSSSSGGGGGGGRSSWSWPDWWKLNAPLVVMNFGSLCTLLAFTRSDVLELRCCSVMGSSSFVVYTILQPPPIRWGPASWSVLFASVNLYKIVQILDERRGNVDLSPRERTIYHEHFKPHGVTPKQFEKVYDAGTTRIVRKGGVITREGEIIRSVKLIVRGNTRASTLGRHLTAMGSREGNRDAKRGGDSGAWIGEIAFLRSVDVVSFPRDMPVSIGDGRGVSQSTQSEPPPARGGVERSIVKPAISNGDEKLGHRAVSTVVAVEDVELIEWSFKDMETVMKSSRDIQDSLTRAMTAAIVGKVVNLMTSRQSAMPKLSTWLDHWKHSRIVPNDDVDESEDDYEE
ncbi:LOW QUALITY PROTEIN: hypothetical protein ACHAXA_011110, partial [Cyclostephanos tholiformis]